MVPSRWGLSDYWCKWRFHDQFVFVGIRSDCEDGSVLAYTSLPIVSDLRLWGLGIG